MLKKVTEGYKGLQWVTKSYKGLQGVTTGFQEFTKFYRVYKGLQTVKNCGYKGLQRVTRV